jgi:hypothetical protein
VASFDIFLSHNSIDKTQVEWVAHKLKSAGLEPWLDKWHLVAGQVWQSDLAEILRTCPTCGIFVGRNGLGDWAREEFKLLAIFQVQTELLTRSLARTAGTCSLPQAATILCRSGRLRAASS